MNNFFEPIIKRRSVYAISNESTIADEKIMEILETAINHCPSPFNSQTSRVFLLKGEEHTKLWNIVLETLRAMIPADKFAPTEEKIAGFAAGYASVMFFEDYSTVNNLMKSFPTYAEHFPNWSHQSSGMVQFAVWTALENEGLGASLQHYNPIIDETVKKTWNIPADWKLLSQMPFGKPTAPAGPKEFMPIKERLFTYG